MKASSTLPASQPPLIGTRDSPIALLSDNEIPLDGGSVPANLKRKTSVDSSTASQNGTAKKKRKTIEIVRIQSYRFYVHMS